MIRSDLKKIRNLLDESVKYIVPKYQRNFTWKKDHAEEFFDDVSQGSVFLGNIVLDTHNEGGGEIGIVDGQQRITTIFIFLAACRHHAQKINSESQSQEIQRKISFIDDTSGRASSSKLVPSPSIMEVFSKTIANPTWDGKTFDIKSKKREASKIRPIYDFFVQKLSKLDKDDLSNLLKAVYESTFIRIEVQDTKEAFEIFERTNARGMELNAADLLKNYLFSSSNSESLSEDWDSIVQNSQGNILRLIKYYYISIFGLIRKSELFKSTKRYGESIGPDKLLTQLKNFSYYYDLITSGDLEDIKEWAHETKNDFFRKEYNANELHRCFEAMRLFGVSQSYPLLVKIFIVVESIRNSEKKNKVSEKFMIFLKTIEKFHFLNYAICQRPGNQIESYYAEKCEYDANQNNVADFMKSIEKEIVKGKLVGQAEFSEKFSELTYGTDSVLIYYIYDRLNNMNRKGGQYISIYNPDKKLLRKNYDIDHLVSQDSSNYDFDEDQIADFVDNIGNLLVISKHTNGSMQNKKITDKIPLIKQLEAQNLPEADILSKEWSKSEWDKTEDVIENINARALNLSKRAYNVCWKIQ